MDVNVPRPMHELADIICYLADHGVNVTLENRSARLDLSIYGIATLATAKVGDIAFLANPRYGAQLLTTTATAVLLKSQDVHSCPPNTIALVVNDPYRAYAILSQLFAYQPTISEPAIHPTAIIGNGAVIGEQVHVGAYCVIGQGVIIGDGCQLGSHVTVEDYATLGKNCRIAEYAFIAHHCQLGSSVTLHSHASIGNAGFGYALNGDTAATGWHPIAQLGRVIIGSHVRVGSHTCVDRGAMGDTVIEDHVIIDNLVQIAHNVRIGAGTAIAACVGIAGSTTVGKRCSLAGGAGIAGHIHICDDVVITGMAMITKSITQAGSYSSGTAMMPTTLWRKAAVKFRQLAIKT